MNIYYLVIIKQMLPISPETIPLEEGTEKFLNRLIDRMTPYLVSQNPIHPEHTRSLDYNTRRIATLEGLDPKVLSGAAILHTAGYSGELTDEKEKREYVLPYPKRFLMYRGSQIAQEVLSDSEFRKDLSLDQITEIVSLIRNFGDTQEVIRRFNQSPEQTRSALALEQANILSQLDPSLELPVSGRQDLERYAEHIATKAQPLFYRGYNDPYFESSAKLYSEQLRKFVDFVSGLPE